VGVFVFDVQAHEVGILPLVLPFYHYRVAD
jgi:hypothetical protein